jgi:hypothetical protein
MAIAFCSGAGRGTDAPGLALRSQTSDTLSQAEGSPKTGGHAAVLQ